MEGPNCGGVHKQAKITFEFWFLILPNQTSLLQKGVNNRMIVVFWVVLKSGMEKITVLWLLGLETKSNFFQKKLIPIFLNQSDCFDNKTIKDSVIILFSSSNTQFYKSWIFCLFTFRVFFPDKILKLISKYTQKCQYNSVY